MPEAILPPLEEAASLPDMLMPDEPTPDLPEEFGEFPPMELGEDEGLVEIPQDLGAHGFPEDNELEGLDIFAVNKGPEETSGRTRPEFRAALATASRTWKK